MQTRTLPAIGFLILGILVLAGCAQAPIALRDMGSFHVGGRDVEISGRPVKEIVFTPGGVPAKVDPNGTYSVEAMYVQYFLPAERRGVVPLLLWHGGGLTGVTYETTPDGGAGAPGQGEGADRSGACRHRRSPAGGRVERYPGADALRRLHRAGCALAADPQKRYRLHRGHRPRRRQGGGGRPAERRHPRQL